METSTLIELILAIATFLSAVSALIVGIRNSGKIQNVHLSLNSRLDQLLTAAKALAHAEGLEEGRDQHTKKG